MKWLYYDYMGEFNPVCVDAGKITGIIFTKDIKGIQDYASAVQVVVADGKQYRCDCKSDFFESYGFVFFVPIGAPRKDFPAGVEHGDEIEMPFRDANYTPITTDPRILYIMYHAFRDDVAELKIPTHDEALRFLRNVGAKTDCIPVQI